MIVLISAIGCNQGCLSVSGDYKDFGGSVNWCFDKDSSQVVQRPVLSNDLGTTALIVTEGELSEINKILEVKASVASTEKIHPIEKFCKLIKTIK